MTFLQTVNNYFYDAYSSLPYNTGESILTSSLCSFAISLVIQPNLERSLIIGGIAGTAALVSALTAPLFEKAFKARYLTWYQDLARIVVNLAITQGLVNSLTTLRTNLVGVAALTVAINLLFTGLRDRPTNRASSYIMF